MTPKQPATPRMTTAVREARGIEEGCKLEQENAQLLEDRRRLIAQLRELHTLVLDNAQHRHVIASLKRSAALLAELEGKDKLG